MLLNCSPKASNSSPVLIEMRWPRSPAPILARLRAALRWDDHAPRQHEVRQNGDHECTASSVPARRIEA